MPARVLRVVRAERGLLEFEHLLEERDRTIEPARGPVVHRQVVHRRQRRRVAGPEPRLALPQHLGEQGRRRVGVPEAVQRLAQAGLQRRDGQRVADRLPFRAARRPRRGVSRAPLQRLLTFLDREGVQVGEDGAEDLVPLLELPLPPDRLVLGRPLPLGRASRTAGLCVEHRQRRPDDADDQPRTTSPAATDRPPVARELLEAVARPTGQRLDGLLGQVPLDVAPGRWPSRSDGSGPSPGSARTIQSSSPFRSETGAWARRADGRRAGSDASVRRDERLGGSSSRMMRSISSSATDLAGTSRRTAAARSAARRG